MVHRVLLPQQETAFAQRAYGRGRLARGLLCPSHRVDLMPASLCALRLGSTGAQAVPTRAGRTTPAAGGRGSERTCRLRDMRRLARPAVAADNSPHETP